MKDMKDDCSKKEESTQIDIGKPKEQATLLESLMLIYYLMKLAIKSNILRYASHMNPEHPSIHVHTLPHPLVPRSDRFVRYGRDKE